MKFQTNVCPLCDKVLRLHQIAKVNIYSCPTKTEWGKSHYEVEYDKSSTIQHIYIGDWSVDNFDNVTKSRIYKKQTANHDKWTFVTDSFRLYADTEENMILNLNKLFGTHE